MVGQGEATAGKVSTMGLDKILEKEWAKVWNLSMSSKASYSSVRLKKKKNYYSL